MIILIVFLVIGVLGLGAFLWKRNRQNMDSKTKLNKNYKAGDVGTFYDQQTQNFLKVYGNIIQAFRTTDVNKLLDYQINSMEFQPGMRVLDAGCGVAGPAIYFAQKARVQVEGLTISSVQKKLADKAILDSGLQKKVRITHGDFHVLEKYYESDSFDRVYFLESFGHATDHEKVIHSAWGMLKPGGILYIKDLFIKEASIASLEQDINREVENINEAYRYNVANLYEILRIVRQKGFILSSLKTIDIPLEDFENLTISNDFQELTGINKIENLQEYVFPVDFFELKCIKPWNALEYGNSRYFLQNLFYMQLHNRKQEEL